MSDCNLISAAEDLKSEEDRLAADKWQLAIMKLRCCGCWMILTSAIWMQQSSIRNSQEDNVTMEHFITSNGHVSLGKRCWELTEGNVSLRTKSVFTRFGSDKEQWDDRRSPHKSKMQPNGPSSGKPS
ncbi:hypothetical protein Csa_007222 [Cucumis sativus]|uniref:Uncharacterized protein n=1 Tax=Cucumis sativus TaxID=3659 RepID=A0A0A0LZH1_CUCSA|nr:hypothetical protein Csa_007222 [Cucumis sativus]